MKGWIIYTDYATKVLPERYELNKFIEEAEKENIEITVIQPEQIDLLVTKENVPYIFIDGFPVTAPDFILPRMGAGTTYPALALIRNLEKKGIFILNSAKCVEITMDKLYAHQTLVEHNIPTPKTMFMRFPVDVGLVEHHLKFPIIVKTVCGSQGSGVFLSKDKKSFSDLMMLLDAGGSTVPIILQEFITTSVGSDLRVMVIGDKVVACMKRDACFGEFKANFSAGGSVENYAVTPAVEQIALQTSKALGLNVAGIDLLFGENGFYVCEASSSPGFRGIESCCNINVAKKTFDYIKKVLYDPNIK